MSRPPNSRNDSTSSNPSQNILQRVWQSWLNASFLVNVTLGALFVFIVATGIGGVVVLDSSHALTQQTETDMRYSSSVQQNQTDLWVNSMHRQSELISNSRTIATGTESEIDAYLDTQVSNLPSEVVSVHYIKLNTNYTSATILQSTEESYGSETPPWGTLSAGDFNKETVVVQSELYQYSTTGNSSTGNNTRPVTAFTTPTHSNTNRAIVVVVDLKQASQRLHAPTDGRSFVVNHDGTVVLSTNPQQIGTDAYTNNALTPKLWDQSHLENSSSATTYYDSNTVLGGDKYTTSMTHTDNADWVAYTQVPHSTAFALRNSIQISMIVLLTGIIISVTIVGAVVGIPVIRDLRRLSNTTQRVSDGNYDDPIESNRTDEIGQVFTDVDDMRASLRARINEVEDLNTKLQRIVQEQSEVMSAVAGGDLTEPMNTATGLTALDELAEDFNDMVDDVRQMVIDIEQSEEEMESFMFIATHDLREPLRMINTYIDLLESEYSDALDDEAEEYMDFIVNSSDRIDVMIEDLYAYLRAKTHDNEFSSENLTTVVEEAQTELHETIDASNATVTVDSLPTTYIDDRQFQEVFENLIGNAIEYTPANRDPEIKISGETYSDRQEHIISIADNGIGIPESQFDKIFEVFNRIERDDDDTGTGIGLAICKRIVEDHDGRIWVESEEGNGTTFHIALPFETTTMQDKFELDRENTPTTPDFDEDTNTS